MKTNRATAASFVVLACLLGVIAATSSADVVAEKVAAVLPRENALEQLTTFDDDRQITVNSYGPDWVHVFKRGGNV